jgi:nucleotidyltransferase/DNA polymerase involved in DNA repair
MTSSTSSKELQQIPGVGPSIERDLRDLGIRRVEDLEGADAEPIDRCVLYVFRCAVYYASQSDHRPELLKWWNWKHRASPGSEHHQ